MGVVRRKKRKSKNNVVNKGNEVQKLSLNKRGSSVRRKKSTNPKSDKYHMDRKRKQKLVPKNEQRDEDDTESDRACEVRSEIMVTMMEKVKAEEPDLKVPEVSPPHNLYDKGNGDHSEGGQLAEEGSKGNCACAVKECSNTNHQRLQFFKIPDEENTKLNEWLPLIGRSDLAGRVDVKTFICEEHFPPSAFELHKSKTLLRPGTLPSLRLPPCAALVGSAGPSPAAPNAAPTSPDIDVALVDTAMHSQIERKKSKQKPPVETKTSLSKKKLAKRLNQKAVFDALCYKFLNRDIAELVKTQADMKFKFNSGKRSYETFCMYLYHTSPHIYISLQKYLKLPSLTGIYKTSLKDGLSEFMKTLKSKVDCMTDQEKNCSVLIGEVELKPHLFYNSADDKLVGFCTVNNEQSPQLARYGLILMVRGICKQWVLPIDYLLLETKDADMHRGIISDWVRNVVSELIQAGLNVRMCLSNLGSSIISESTTAQNTEKPTIDKPFFYIHNNRIYYAYDPTFLMKSVYWHLLQHEFQFQGLKAKWQDILEFYESDSKKTHRLVPELSDKHARPKEGDIVEARYAVETLSERVAAGIANYIDFGQMNASASGTVALLTMMGKLYKFMTSAPASNSCDYRKPFNGSDFQMSFVTEALTFLRDLNILENGSNITDHVKFVKQFQISIRATMLLFENLTLENIPYLCTNKISFNVFDNFVLGIIEKSKTKDITAWRFIAAQRKMLFHNMFKRTNKKFCPEMVDSIFQQYLDNKPLCDAFYLKENQKISTLKLAVKISDYKELKLPKKDQIIPICELLLRKCNERHLKCSLPNKRKAEQGYTRYKGFFGDVFSPNSPDPWTVPNDDLIHFVEQLDAELQVAFDEYFESKQLLSALPLAPSKPSLSMPCACFPIAFMVKLYYRLRVSQQLKMNNRRFKKLTSSEVKFRFVNLK